jgi:hypothetical protein
MCPSLQSFLPSPSLSQRARGENEKTPKGLACRAWALTGMASNLVENQKAPQQGLEHTEFSSEKARCVAKGDAKSDALIAQNGDFPPELVEVISTWPKLPEEVHHNIVAMVRKAVGA